MPFVNCFLRKKETSDLLLNEIKSGIESALRETGGVKASIHIGFIDTDYDFLLVQVWWTERPKRLVEETNKEIYEKLKGFLPHGQGVCVIFNDIKRGNFGYNGEIINSKPDPARGIY